MAFPDYIPTRVVTIGQTFSLESSAGLPISLTVKATRSMVWLDTGYRFESTGLEASAEPGSQISIELPVTDLEGWIDSETKMLIDASAPGSFTHEYIAVLTVGSARYTYGPFILPSGGSAVDLDVMVTVGTLPAGQVEIPISTGGGLIAVDVTTGQEERPSGDIVLWNDPLDVGPTQAAYDDLISGSDAVRPARRAPLTAAITGTIPTTKETYESGLIKITTSSGATIYSDPAQFRGRGNSTWLAPKKPYKFRPSSAEETPLGMGASRDWALMADFFDQSFLRTTIGFEIGRRATGRWAPHSEHVRLVWNGDYKGLYRVSETADLEPGRIDYREMEDTDTGGNALTGPYYLEVNNPLDDAGFTTAMGTPVLYDVPGVAGVAEQEAYIQGWVNALEDALVNGTEEDILPLVDIPSWVDAYLLAEVLRVQDAGWHKSCKFIKDQDAPNGTGKAILWAPWDYDLSLGTDLNDGGPYEQSPTGWWIRTGPDAVGGAYPNWWYWIWQKSQVFRDACWEAWNDQFLPVLAEIDSFIDEEYAKISALITEDRGLWQGGTALPAEHTPAFIKDFLATRTAWISANLNPTPDTTPPDAPTALTSTSVTDTAVTLSWTAPAGDPVGYEYRVDGGAPVDAGAGTSEVVSGLTAETEYDFEVRAYDVSDNFSAWSTVYTVTTEPFVGGGGGTYPDEVLLDSPIGYWKLDEAAGITAVDDASPNGRDMTLFGTSALGAAGLIPDSAGAWSKTSAVGNYISADHAAWMEQDSFTVEAIIRPTSVSSYNCIFSFDGTGAFRAWSWYLLDGALIIFRGTDDAVFSSDPFIINADTTYHVAVTYSAGTIKFYKNGVQSGPDRAGVLANGSTIPQGLVIGASYAGQVTPTLGFTGTLDEVAYYSGALSSARILAHAQAAGLA